MLHLHVPCKEIAFAFSVKWYQFRGSSFFSRTSCCFHCFSIFLKSRVPSSLLFPSFHKSAVEEILPMSLFAVFTGGRSLTAWNVLLAWRSSRISLCIVEDSLNTLQVDPYLKIIVIPLLLQKSFFLAYCIVMKIDCLQPNVQYVIFLFVWVKDFTMPTFICYTITDKPIFSKE